jgi:hypothetical protein
MKIFFSLEALGTRSLKKHWNFSFKLVSKEDIFERQLKVKLRCSFDFIFSYITILLLVFFGKNEN